MCIYAYFVFYHDNINIMYTHYILNRVSFTKLLKRSIQQSLQHIIFLVLLHLSHFCKLKIKFMYRIFNIFTLINLSFCFQYVQSYWSSDNIFVFIILCINKSHIKKYFVMTQWIKVYFKQNKLLCILNDNRKLKHLQEGMVFFFGQN